MRPLAFLVFLMIAGASNAQSDTMRSRIDDPAPFIDPVEMPSFPGGEVAMYEFIKRNLRYPDIDTEGRVFVEFSVGVDGTLSDVRIKRGVHELLDMEALRLVGSFPNWEPSKVNGKPAPIRYTLPILFRR